MSYFDKLPTIFYNGQQARNLLARAKLTPKSQKDMSLYYPYTIKDSDGRADTLAYAYYNDPYAVWLMYFANEVVDPYFDLGLDQTNFDKHIVKKYGSMENAQSKIAFYRTNWELLDDSSITIENYNILQPEEKKYWEPVVDIYGTINRYQRKKEDLIVNTNRILELTISPTAVFTKGEKVSISPTKYGYVVDSIDSLLTIHHVTGITTSDSNTTITGKESNSSSTISSITVVAENLSPDIQAKYWIAVSHYDRETEVNTLKKNIRLIDKRFKSQMEDELKRTLS